MGLAIRTAYRSFALAILCVGALSVFFSSADASVVTSGNLTVTFDFTGFTGAGFSSSPAAGQLDSDDWSILGMSDGALGFGGTGTSGDFARGTSGGGVTTGGIYAFDVDASAIVNRALGVQPGGNDFNPGSIILQIVNNTGSTIVGLGYAFDVLVFNDQARANSFNFLIDSDAGAITNAVTLETLTSPAAAVTPATWAATSFSDSTTGLSIANGATFYVLWQGADVSGSGSRDEFALDNVSLTVRLASTEVIPEASAALIWSILCGSVVIGAKRRRDVA